MRIRRAGPADARVFAALTRSEIEPGLPHGWTAARLARLLAYPDTNAYALVSEHGVGGLSVARFGLQRGHLMLHAVAPGLRRRGFGHELLDWQLRAAATAGLESLTLEVRAANDVARRFYAAHGFRAERRLPRYYAGREDAVRMTTAPPIGADGSSPDRTRPDHSRPDRSPPDRSPPDRPRPDRSPP